jgi:hypothetical protein
VRVSLFSSAFRGGQVDRVDIACTLEPIRGQSVAFRDLIADDLLRVQLAYLEVAVTLDVTVDRTAPDALVADHVAVD